MAKTELSIIVVSFNTKSVTKKCLDSILKSLKNSKLNYEIVVVDNDSKDGSVALLNQYKKRLQDQLQLILNKENTGFGKANNQAVKISQGKYILFLNSDAFVLNNAIEKLLEFYKKSQDIGFVGGKLLNQDLTDQPSAAPFFTIPVTFAALFLKGDYWGLTRYSPEKIKKVGWISGACILTKKEIFEKVGGFDEGVFMYMEEVDLLYRASKQGYSTLFYPEAKFIHLGFASSGSKSYPVIQVFRGLIYFYKKNRSSLSLFVLRIMLKLKAKISILIGKATKNRYLIETYEKAFKMASMA